MAHDTHVVDEHRAVSRDLVVCLRKEEVLYFLRLVDLEAPSLPLLSSKTSTLALIRPLVVSSDGTWYSRPHLCGFPDA